MESQYKVHHLTVQLLAALNSDLPPETFVEELCRNNSTFIVSQASVHTAKNKLTKNVQEKGLDPAEFRKTYMSLKTKQLFELDPYTYFLGKCLEDKRVLDFMESVDRVPSLDSTPDVNASDLILETIPRALSQKEVEEVRNQLAIVKANEEKRKAMQLKKLPNLVARTLLTKDFVIIDEEYSCGPQPLHTMTALQQENAIVEDLLYVLTGIEGQYILVEPLDSPFGQRRFKPITGLDPGIGGLVNKILPLCSCYSIVTRFLDHSTKYSAGTVNQALCAAIKTLVKEYVVLIAQLEEQHAMGQLSIQKMWLFIQSCISTFYVLATICHDVINGGCRGGTTLSLLHDKTFSLVGEAASQDLCLYLTQAACVPYFGMLEKWLYKGMIDDPYNEFFVEEFGEGCQLEQVQRKYELVYDTYWEKRYSLNIQQVPLFLGKIAEKVLHTGKYLNVIRHCGYNVQCPDSREIKYTLVEREYMECIETAYGFASQRLLTLLMEEHKLMERLYSIKSFFLMGQGDVFVHFMDMAEHELRKKHDDIVSSRIESLLDLAVRTSVAASDPFKEDLKVDIVPYDLITQLFRIINVRGHTLGPTEQVYPAFEPHASGLTGVEAFTLDYRVEWPVSLVVSRKSITKYQLLFRHLFHCKHVERQLCAVWQAHKQAKWEPIYTTKWHAAAFCLRQRMLSFISNYSYYAMFEVIERQWHIFNQEMQTVKTIDNVLAIHNDFLETCLKDCLLTTPELLRSLAKLQAICVNFSNAMLRLIPSASVSIATQAEQNMKMHSQEHFEELIKNFDSNFTLLTLQLLINIQTISKTASEHHLSYLMSRLDPNDYYARLMEQNPHLVEQAAKLNEDTRGESPRDGVPPPSGLPPPSGAPPPSGGAVPVRTQSTSGLPRSGAASKSLSSASTASNASSTGSSTRLASSTGRPTSRSGLPTAGDRRQTGSNVGRTVGRTASSRPLSGGKPSSGKPRHSTNV